MSTIDPGVLALLSSTAQALSAVVAALASTPVAPAPEPVHPGMPEQLARSWEDYPGKGVAHHQRDGRWVDVRGAYAKAPRKAKAKATTVQSPPSTSRVDAVAQREREQIAEARRLERLWREGHLSREQAYELAWHQIGKKRARAMMSD